MGEKLHKGQDAPLNAATVKVMVTSPCKCRVGEEDSMLAEIIKTILRYPVGTRVGFADEFATEYDTVSGYMFSGGAFYILFLSGHIVNMQRLKSLVVSTEKEGKDADKQKSNQRRQCDNSAWNASGDWNLAGSAGGCDDR